MVQEHNKNVISTVIFLDTNINEIKIYEGFLKPEEFLGLL